MGLCQPGNWRDEGGGTEQTTASPWLRRPLRAAPGWARGGVVRGLRHEGAVGAEAAVGHQQMHVRVPVGQRPVGLDGPDDADREIGLPGERPYRRRDRGRGQARQVAEEGAVRKSTRSPSSRADR